jgi:hypothetical protein
VIVAASVRKADRAFYDHYNAKHLDRCETCDEPVRWIRAEKPGGGVGEVLMLDPDKVEDGDVESVLGTSQPLARMVDRESLLEIRPGFQLHAHQVVRRG